jgi:hypothetical protein
VTRKNEERCRKGEREDTERSGQKEKILPVNLRQGRS